MTPPPDVHGVTHVGKRRRENQDQFFVGTLARTLDVQATSVERAAASLRRAEARILVVADGVGGSKDGRLASANALQTVVRQLASTPALLMIDSVDHEHAAIEQIERSVRRAHQRLLDRFGTGRGAPATTLTIAILVGPRVYHVHVGDSRLYYLRKGRLRQITRDQTMAERFVDEGAMTADQAEVSGFADVLTSAVGGIDSIEVSVGLIDLHPDDVLLLCSDGLTKHASDDEIAAMLMHAETAGDACDALLQHALDGGGSDNITTVVARMPPRS